MRTAAYRSNMKKLAVMAAIALAAAAAYMLFDLNFGNSKLLSYGMRTGRDFYRRTFKRFL